MIEANINGIKVTYDSSLSLESVVFYVNQCMEQADIIDGNINSISITKDNDNPDEINFSITWK